MAKDAELEAKERKDVLKEIRKGVLEGLITSKAIPNVSAMLDDKERPWAERSVSDVASLDLVRMGMGLLKANEAANAPQPTLGVLVMVPQMATAEEWEAQFRPAIEAKVIEPEGKP